MSVEDESRTLSGNLAPNALASFREILNVYMSELDTDPAEMIRYETNSEWSSLSTLFMQSIRTNLEAHNCASGICEGIREDHYSVFQDTNSLCTKIYRRCSQALRRNVRLLQGFADSLEMSLRCPKCIQFALFYLRLFTTTDYEQAAEWVVEYSFLPLLRQIATDVEIGAHYRQQDVFSAKQIYRQALERFEVDFENGWH